MTDHLPAVRRLISEGHGDRHIAGALGVTRHVARGLMNKLKLEDVKASFAAIQPLARVRGPAFLKTAEDYATAIAECWQTSVEAIFETGRLLMAAKASLAHGEFLPMVKTQLPFGESTAARLMKIAADTKLQNRNAVQHLPPSWGTLYELTKLDDTAFQHRITDGTIRPDMERRDIATAVKATRRAARESHLGEMQAAANLKLPDKRYGVIQGDPQWGRTVYSRATGMDRHAANHYPTANGDEVTQDDPIKALGVAAIAAPDCVLGLWCTEPWRGEAVLRAWGFEPKAYFVWVKDIVADVPEGIGNGIGMLRSGQRLSVVGAAGLGFWNRDRCEIMLIGVRGKPVCPAPGTQGERVWFARRGEHAVTRDDIHSDKPDCSFEWFERHWPNTPKIELNARRARPGWDCWGLDAPIDAPPHDPETGEVTPSTSAQEAAE